MPSEKSENLFLIFRTYPSKPEMALLMFRIVLDIFTELFLNEFIILDKSESLFQMFRTGLPKSEMVFLMFRMALENPERHILKEFTCLLVSSTDRADF